MLILALESSAKPASVAVCSDGELLGQYFQNSGLTHSRTLLAMVKSLLANLDVPLSGIDLVAVSRGPGSFTGVRIGVAAAKGLAWGLDKPVCGVSTLEAMAYQAQEQGALLCPVMDARRGQVYNALFELRGREPSDDAGGAIGKDEYPVSGTGFTLARLCEDRAISLEDLARELGAQRSPVYLVGDGAALAQGYLASAGIPCRMAPDLMRCQTAFGVALAAMHAIPITAIELEPSYLRPSQAERELLR